MNSKMTFRSIAYSATCSAWLLASSAVVADITLQETGETLTGDMTISQEMGLTQGTNLLHTFLAFNVDAGESATFTGSNAITNIVARVSGDGASQIDGLLRSTITDANLFLINPNGVAFGAGASIDINGSLHISTADSIVFGDDSRLLVSDTGASGFTAAAPSAFGFSGVGAGITFDGTMISTLNTDRAASLSLVGGDITLSESSITFAGGTIDLIATQGEQDVAITMADRSFDNTALGAITITNAEFVAGKVDLDVSGDAAGQLSLAGANVTLERAFVFSDTEGTGTGGAINVLATDALTLTEGARITTDTTGGGAGGDLVILAGDVSLSGTNTALAASTISAGGIAGSIDVTANSIDILDGAQVSSVTSTASPGGDITLNTGDLTMASGGQISGQATSRGQGADVVINASQSIVIDATGTNAGEETGIRVDSINFLPFFVGGDAGDIVITAPSLTLKGSAVIAAQASLPSSGAPGAITLNVEQLAIEGGSSVSTLSSASADAGAISVNSSTVALIGAGSGFNSTTRRSGGGGSIVVMADNFTMSGGATADTSTEGAGAAGDISIDVTGSVNLTDASSELASRSSGEGRGGNISVSGESLTFSNNGVLSVTASGAGDAGNISLMALNRLEVLDGAQVQTNAENSGGGNIDVAVIDTIYLRNGILTASAGGAEGSSNGGNINIDPRFLILDNASIVAQAVAGNGGVIELVADNYIADINSFLDASSELGNDGEVRITTPYNSISGVLGTLNANFDAVAQIATDACSARNLEQRSSLIVEQKRGNLNAPGDLRPIQGEEC